MKTDYTFNGKFFQALGYWHSKRDWSILRVRSFLDFYYTKFLDESVFMLATRLCNKFSKQQIIDWDFKVAQDFNSIVLSDVFFDKFVKPIQGKSKL